MSTKRRSTAALLACKPGSRTCSLYLARLVREAHVVVVDLLGEPALLEPLVSLDSAVVTDHRVVLVHLDSLE